MKNQIISTKESYINPECKVVNIETEGIICSSNGNANISNTNVFDYEEGGSYDISIF